MLSHPWIRYGLAAVAGIAAVFAGFFFFGSSVQHQVAMQSSQSQFGTSKLNILILGYQDDEETTDTIVLAHLDVDRRTATLVSIPRDSWVAMPDGSHAKINAAYAYGGAKGSKSVVSRLFGGIPIDAVVALQPEGAAQIVDAMGGLNVDVDENMDYDDNYGDLHIHLKKGEQYLTGSQVVGYVRFRHDAQSDFGRMHRQQQVMRLLLNELSLPQNWSKLPRIMSFAREDVKTTLSDRQLVALLEVYRSVPEENVRTFTLPGVAGWVGDASVVFVDPRWAGLIGRLLFTKSDPPQEHIVVANATGDDGFDKTILGALRGGGWNVDTAIDQPVKPTSMVLGDGAAAQSLAQLFSTRVQPARTVTLVLGSDLAPHEE
jgi:LCP family protein required for cell wall assembly